MIATGGTPPYHWSVDTSDGVGLPEGMLLDPATGIVSSAMVTGQGGYQVAIVVTDSASPSPAVVSKLFNIGVHSDTSYGGCQMFPPDSIFNQRVDQLPVDTNPSHQIPTSYLSRPLHPDFGQGFYPNNAGIPFLRVPSNQPVLNVNVAWGGQGDAPGVYSWPFLPWPMQPTEGGSYGLDGSDHHMLVLQSSVSDINGPQTGPCILYETYDNVAVPGTFDAASQTWNTGGGIHYVLNSNDLAASTETLDNGGQDSAGIPMVPLLMRYADVPLAAHHPLRITFPQGTNWFVWPGTGCCHGTGPPQGLLYRLKASVNWQAACPATGYPQAATVLQALQQYGAYMSDHGGTGFISGVPDDRWQDDDLACIKRFHVSDLEVVDNSALEISAISGQTRPYVVPGVLPNGAVGAAYNATLSEVGGNPGSIEWSVSSGTLPPGLAFDTTAATLSGTITSANGSPFLFHITARDTWSGYSSVAQPFSITVGSSSPAPQWATEKTHTGAFVQGRPEVYTVTVGNQGAASTTGVATVTETVPNGMTLTSMAGAGWTCPPGGNTCWRSDPLAPGGAYSAITVTVALSRTIAAQVTNLVSVAGGGSQPASAQDVTSIYMLAPQTITFGALPDLTIGSPPWTVSATATSSLPVSFASLTTGVCTVSGSTVTLAAPGTCTIQATQAGDSDYAAAPPVSRSFQVTAPSAATDPGTVPFPGTIVGKNSPTQTVALRNSGAAALTISSIRPAGADAANFQYAVDPVHPCPLAPATLDPGASCTLDLIFAPVSEGPHSAQIVIADNSGGDPAATQSIGVSGNGVVLRTIAILTSPTTLAVGARGQFTATGAYTDSSAADLTAQVKWSSTQTTVAAVDAHGSLTTQTAGQTNITATKDGVASNTVSLTVIPSAPSAISMVAGSGQIATVGTAFAAALQAVVKDANGNPVPNVPVTWSAPTTGPSGTFTNSGATDAAGIAAATVTANSAAGAYTITASVSGVSVSFSLTNLPPPVLIVAVAHAGNFVAGQSGATFTITVSNAAGAGPTSGAVSVMDALPAGLTLLSMNGGPLWNCSASCTTGAVLNPGANYPAIAVTVAVTAAPGASLTSQVTLSGGASSGARASDTAKVFSKYDLDQDGVTGAGDVLWVAGEALGLTSPRTDLNQDGTVNVIDVQILVNAATPQTGAAR